MNKKIIAAALMQVAVLAASFTPSFAHGGFSINIGGGGFGYNNGYHHYHQFYSPYNYYQPVYPINTFNTYSTYGTLPVTNPIFVNQSTVPVVIPQVVPECQVRTYNW